MTLERIEHKVFASEAPLEEMGQFGSALATTKLNTKDVAEIQALPAYTKGWGSAIVSENNYPAMEEMNGVLNVMSYHTGYLYQEGIPTYSATQEYSVTSWVKDLAGEKVYKSLQGGNKGHDLTDPAWWEELKLGGGGLEIGDIGFTQMAIDETKGKRRVLNGQLIIQEQYVQFTNIIKSSVALNPDLACTEEEWQTAVTMSANGVCYKYVIDDEAGTIRLPKYPAYLDLSINTGAKTQTVSVYGDGKALGFTNGSQYFVKFGSGHGGYANAYGKPVGTTVSGSATGTTGAWGVTPDATKSGITGKVTIPAVQSEKVKGTYFIQVATGSETEDNIINEIELNNPYSLGDSKYSPVALNNLSWLKSEGQWNSKAIYPSYYDWALTNFNNGVEGFALSTGEYTDYDVVINPAEETFRLSLLDGSESIIDWDNIIKDLSPNVDHIVPCNGAFIYSIQSAHTGKGGTDFTIIINGEQYIFGQGYSGTDYPHPTNGFLQLKKGDVIKFVMSEGQKVDFVKYVGNGSLYFYVGETVQNANLINAGRIEEKLSSCITRNDCKAYITETYVNGTSWYRVYSDGWCEQGAIAQVTNGQSGYSVSLLKPLTSYSVQLTMHAEAYATTGWGASSLTSTSFKIFNSVSAIRGCAWLAYGWLA